MWRLIGFAGDRDAREAGRGSRRGRRGWTADEARWRRLRAKYLLYR